MYLKYQELDFNPQLWLVTSPTSDVIVFIFNEVLTQQDNFYFPKTTHHEVIEAVNTVKYR